MFTRKSYVFSMWNKNVFCLNTSTLKDNIISFQHGINFFKKYSFKLHYLQDV